MEATCTRANCTVAQTGICLLNHKSPAECPEVRQLLAADAVTKILEDGLKPLVQPLERAQLPASHALTLEKAAAIMTRRYCHVIGIVGSPDAGKTASIASLYLLLSGARLRDLEFADSKSLMALDEISRGARRWNQGEPPEEMTAHTVQTDARAAGLLHIRLLSRASGRRVDLLLPDLPGEWSTSLIDTNRVDRFDFLKSADCIWVMVDGQQLRDSSTRRLAAHRTILLIKRLYEFLSPAKPRIKLVLTRRDTGAVPEAAISSILAEAGRCGLSIDVAEIASFADGTAVEAGHGIEDLILGSVRSTTDVRPLWPHADEPDAARWVLNYRCEGEAK